MEKNPALSPGFDFAQFEKFANDLETRFYSVIPNAVNPDLLDSMYAHFEGLTDQDFQRAGVGRGAESVRNQFVRRNSICWHNPEDPRAREWFDWIEEIRTFLNRRLFLGATSFESHFTRYDKDDFYRRHMDAFLGQRNRIVSLVTYLNNGWQPDQGGELVLYPKDADPVRVTPEAGTLVLFMSEELPHEVLPSCRTRFGVAGWFRIDAADVVQTG